MDFKDKIKLLNLAFKNSYIDENLMNIENKVYQVFHDNSNELSSEEFLQIF